MPQVSRARARLKLAGEEWPPERAKSRPRAGREPQDPTGGHPAPGKAAARRTSGVWGALLSKVEMARPGAP